MGEGAVNVRRKGQSDSLLHKVIRHKPFLPGIALMGAFMAFFAPPSGIPLILRIPWASFETTKLIVGLIVSVLYVVVSIVSFYCGVKLSIVAWRVVRGDFDKDKEASGRLCPITAPPIPPSTP